MKRHKKRVVKREKKKKDHSQFSETLSLLSSIIFKGQKVSSWVFFMFVAQEKGQTATRVIEATMKSLKLLRKL